MIKQNVVSKRLYYIGIALALTLAGVYLYMKANGLTISLSFSPCPIYENLGIYCPGCGGTRAINALMRGEIWQSLLYHPVILYVLGIYLIFMISYTLHRLTKGKLPYLKVNYVTLITILAVILMQWAIKVFLQLEYGYLLL